MALNKKRPVVRQNLGGAFKMTLRNHVTTLSGLSRGLTKVRWHSDYKFIACCPAHDNRNPSLSVTDIGGKILLKCFAGCSQECVIATLRELGLWHSASRYQVYRRKRCELKDKVRHHQQILALGIAMSDQGQELSEDDQARMEQSVKFLQDHANG